MDIITINKKARGLIIGQTIVICFIILSFLPFIVFLQWQKTITDHSGDLLSPLLGAGSLMVIAFFGGVGFIHGVYALIRHSRLSNKLRKIILIPQDTLVLSKTKHKLNWAGILCLIETVGVALVYLMTII